MISYYGSNIASVATDCFTVICIKKDNLSKHGKKMQNNNVSICII